MEDFMKLLSALAVFTALVVSTSAQTAGPGIASLAGDPVLVGAGDIADCSTTTDSATAAVLDGIDGTVFVAGDNAYLTGSTEDYANCYEPTWGRHKTRTRPAPGNHEYMSVDAAPYYAYFGAHSGPAGRGYYSYDLGAWHIVSLNSNVAVNAGSAQEQWLRADLAANRTQCTLAYWHHPYFSSGIHGDNPYMRDIYQALYDFGADVVVTGHDHDYEQFHRQNADGVLDANGIREFVVGTGGTTLRPFDAVAHPNTAVRDSTTHGVLKLTLHPTSFDWNFVPIAGGSFTDSGSRDCVGSAPPAVGGRGFAVGGAVGGRELLWTTGTVQSNYAIARITGGTATILPTVLPGTATQYTDAAAPAGQLNCYALLPVNAGGLAGTSDVLCSVPNTHSAVGAPANAMVQLNQSSMATIAWSPPGGQTSFSLLTIPLNGSAQSVVPLPAIASRTMHETGGVPTCYAVLAMTGATVSGNSDIVCAIPGRSNLGSGL
jgi:hypothetical protein